MKSYSLSSCASVTFKSLSPLWVFFAVVQAFTPAALGQNVVFKVPPVKIPLEIKGQPISITASAILTLSSQDRNTKVLNLQLTADLSELQRNLTAVLSSQLNKDDRCGERIAIQNATLKPVEPASLAVVQLHVERYACVKVLGKQAAKRILGGDATAPIKLTPVIQKDSTELQLQPEVGEIQADGSLGELLRSGALGDAIQDKVRTSILNALDKGTDLAATLPPAVQGYVTIRSAGFKDGGDGNLLALLDGEVRITQEQMKQLSAELKQRMPSR